MRVTRTRRIARQQNHLLGGAPKEQEHWITYYDIPEIPDELWHKVMAIKRAKKRAEKRAKNSRLGPPNKFSSVPINSPEIQVQLNMSQSLITESEFNQS